jgi:hypothetical protein
VQAFDGKGNQLRPARVWMGRSPAGWQLTVRAPMQARKLVLTLRNQTLEIPTPDGQPADVPVWKLK